MVNIPAPVGGTPLPSDFVPSIVFVILYILLVPLAVYRLTSRRSRSFLLIGAAIFTIERIVTHSLRAIQSRSDKSRFSVGITMWMQITLTMGYVNIANDSLNFIRCLLVNPTFGSETFHQSSAAATKGAYFNAPPPDTPDRPQLRFWIRRLFDLLRAIFFAAIVPGILAHVKYSQVLVDQDQADKTTELRYLSAGVTFGMCIVLLMLILWSLFKYPSSQLSRRSVAVYGTVVGLIAIVSLYRLLVLHFKVTSLKGPSPLNTQRAKLLFYILHVSPEWLVLFILLSINVRKTFSTGPMGDRSKDKGGKSEEIGQPLLTMQNTSNIRM